MSEYNLNVQLLTQQLRQIDVLKDSIQNMKKLDATMLQGNQLQISIVGLQKQIITGNVALITALEQNRISFAYEINLFRKDLIKTQLINARKADQSDPRWQKMLDNSDKRIKSLQTEFLQKQPTFDIIPKIRSQLANFNQQNATSSFDRFNQQYNSISNDSSALAAGKSGTSQQTKNPLYGLGKTFETASLKIAKPFAGLDSAMKGQVASMKDMTKSMITTTLVINPLMSVVNNLLEPFNILSETFGAIGSILGMYLLPAIIPVNTEFQKLLPFFSDLLPIITPISGALGDFIANTTTAHISLGVLNLDFDNLTAKFESLTTIMTATNDSSNTISEIFGSIGTSLSSVDPLLGTFDSSLSTIDSNLGNLKTTFLDITSSISSLDNIDIQAIFDPVLEFFSPEGSFNTTLQTWVNNFSTWLLDEWNKIGTKLTGGGSDNYGWW